MPDRPILWRSYHSIQLGLGPSMCLTLAWDMYCLYPTETLASGAVRFPSKSSHISSCKNPSPLTVTKTSSIYLLTIHRLRLFHHGKMPRKCFPLYEIFCHCLMGQPGYNILPDTLVQFHVHQWNPPETSPPHMWHCIPTWGFQQNSRHRITPMATLWFQNHLIFWSQLPAGKIMAAMNPDKKYIAVHNYCDVCHYMIQGVKASQICADKPLGQSGMSSLPGLGSTLTSPMLLNLYQWCRSPPTAFNLAS